LRFAQVTFFHQTLEMHAPAFLQNYPSIRLHEAMLWVLYFGFFGGCMWVLWDFFFIFFNAFLKSLENTMLLLTHTYLFISAVLSCSWKTFCHIMCNYIQ